MDSRNQAFFTLSYLAFLNGWYVSSFGPLIPYFTEATGLDETHYSYLFMVRSIANIVGGILIKYLIKKLKTSVLIYGMLGIVIVCLLLASLSPTTVNLSFNLFLTSVALVSIVIITYSVIFKIFQNQNPDYWIQLIGFIFGVGAMAGPILIMIFELQTYKALSIAHLVAAAFLFKYPITNVEQQGEYQQKPNTMRLSQNSVLLISLTFFFFATQELGVASWISTYSIKAGVAQIDSSAMYSTYFWVVSCIFRVVWMYLPGSVEHRIGLGLKGTLLSIIFSWILQYGQYYHAVCLVMPILSAMWTAGIFGLIISLAVDKGFASNSTDNSNIVLGNSLGEGLLIMPLGYSMGLFGFQILIVQLFLLVCLCYWTFTLSIKSMEQDKSKFQSSLLNPPLPKQQTK